MPAMTFGQDKESGRGKGKSKQRPPKIDLIKRYDTDKDQRLSRAEFDEGERAKKLDQEVRAKLFARLDKNGDGFISRDELPKMPEPHDGKHFMGRADADGDGRISFEEFAKNPPPPFKNAPKERLKEMFDRWDRNNDGFLDAKDRPERRPDRRRPLPRIVLGELDLDQDGKLSKEEFLKAPAFTRVEESTRVRIFERLDSNQDGFITPEELKAAQDRERRGGPERKGGPGGRDGKGPKK